MQTKLDAERGEDASRGDADAERGDGGRRRGGRRQGLGTGGTAAAGGRGAGLGAGGGVGLVSLRLVRGTGRSTQFWFYWLSILTRSLALFFFGSIARSFQFDRYSVRSNWAGPWLRPRPNPNT